MKNLILIFFFAIAFSSCSKDCLTCELSTPDFNNSIEYCDDGEITYTNQNGEPISFDDLINQQESLGYICK